MAPLPIALVTGFDAFGGADFNPSWLAVQRLANRVVAGHRLIAEQLPTEFAASSIRLDRLLESHRPRLVMCTGVAASRAVLSMERVAININDARIADNRGAQPIDMPVIDGAPAAYFSTLPIKAMVCALQRAGFDAEVSQSAGTFVCNHVFYQLMHRLATGYAGSARLHPARGGFVHVPFPGAGGMSLDDIVRGLEVAMHCALTAPSDIAITGGSIG